MHFAQQPHDRIRFEASINNQSALLTLTQQEQLWVYPFTTGLNSNIYIISSLGIQSHLMIVKIIAIAARNVFPRILEERWAGELTLRRKDGSLIKESSPMTRW